MATARKSSSGKSASRKRPDKERKKFRMLKRILIIAAILAVGAIVVLVALWALGHIAIVSRV